MRDYSPSFGLTELMNLMAAMNYNSTDTIELFQCVDCGTYFERPRPNLFNPNPTKYCSDCQKQHS